MASLRAPSRSRPSLPMKSVARCRCIAAASRASMAAAIASTRPRSAASGSVRPHDAHSAITNARRSPAPCTRPRMDARTRLPVSRVFSMRATVRGSASVHSLRPLCGALPAPCQPLDPMLQSILNGIARNAGRTSRGGERMTIERPWLAQYPAGVPAEIDVDEFQSIPAVLEQSIRQFGDRPAFTNMGKALTYAQIDELSRQFAGYLLGELKLKKGDRVAIMMPNCLQYPIATFGVLRAGLTVVNVNPMYTARELKHQLVDSGAAVVLVLDNFARTVQEVLPHTEVQQVITTGLGDLLGFPKGPIVNF